jgi:hypothetical protein
MSAFGEVDRPEISQSMKCYTKIAVTLNYTFLKPPTVITFPPVVTTSITGVVINRRAAYTETVYDYVIMNYDATIVRDCVCLSESPFEDCDDFAIEFEFGTDYSWDCTRYKYCGLPCDKPDVVGGFCECTLNEGAVEFFEGTKQITLTAGLNDAQIQAACQAALENMFSPKSDHIRCSCDC